MARDGTPNSLDEAWARPMRPIASITGDRVATPPTPFRCRMLLPVLVPAVGKGVGHMEESPRKMVDGHAVVVPAGGDRFGERRSLGISTIAFKVLPSDRHDHLIVENVFHAVGGPARHLHHHQDEWFYVVEGTFEFEVGSERMQLRPGDSLMAPQGVPHVWAHVGTALGRVLIAFLPAGRMEAFFREVTQANAMPPLDAALWSAHGMELLGPPLAVSPLNGAT
jgi:quercetin dioxygenase-like cupin family protein